MDTHLPFEVEDGNPKSTSSGRTDGEFLKPEGNDGVTTLGQGHYLEKYDLGLTMWGSPPIIKVVIIRIFLRASQIIQWNTKRQLFEVSELNFDVTDP